MVDIYNRFVARVHDKLFNDGSAVDGAAGGAAAVDGAAGGAAAVDGAAGGSPSVVSKFTVQELHKLKTEYDKGAAWTTEEVQELCALPLIMLKAQWKDEHQLSTFREQLTQLMKHISELQKASGKHDHEIAALKQVIAELKQAEAGSSVVAAGGAGSSSAAAGGAGSSVVAAGGAGSSIVAAGPAPVVYGSAGVGEGFCRISPSDTYIAAGVVPGTFMIVTNGMARIFQSTGYNRTVLDEARKAHLNSTFKGYTREDYRDMDTLPMIVRKLFWQLTANHRDSWNDRSELRGRIRGAEDRLKKLEAGPGYTRDELRNIKATYDVCKPLTEEEERQQDAMPLIFRKYQWRAAHNRKIMEVQISKLTQSVGTASACAVDLDTRLKVVEAAGASAADLDARLKKLEAGPGYTRESIKEIQAKYVVNAPMTEEERASWDEQPLILRKFQWRVNYNNECILKRVTKLEQQALPMDQPAAAGASMTDLDTRLKKLEAGTGHTREDIRKIKAGYDVTKNLTDEEFTQLAGIPLILQKTHWRFHANIQASWNRINGVKKEIAELKQALATEQQATSELKQALAKEQQATASQAQEIAALKLAMATQGQAVQSMDAHTAQIMQAVQAVVGPMRDELEELRRRVATLESARPAGFGMAVKKEPKKPA
jgi:hypothetical protein